MMALISCRRLTRSLAFLIGLLVASCGGVDSGGTGGSVVAVGPIGGLGSIIVNGTRFDDSAAAITDDDGQAVGRERLTLGVFTVVEGELAPAGGAVRQATATRIRVSSDLIGEVQAVDRSTRTFKVLEQNVRVTAATAFDGGLSLGIDGLRAGQSVEVYGPFDPASGSYVATRVELRALPVHHLVRGRIDAVDLPRGLVRIGALTVDVSGLSAAEAATLVFGATVRLRLQPGATAGSWRAVSASSAERALADSTEGTVEGRISSFTSASRFTVNGVAVDATGAAFPDGSGLAVGLRVKVEGVSRNGTLIAREVHIEGEEDASNSTFEVHGRIESIDVARKLLVLRGVAVDYSGAVTFIGGTEANLALGRKLEVRGRLQADGIGLIAQQITFEAD